MKKYCMIKIALASMYLLCSFAFASVSIPKFDISKLAGRYSCKTGDRESRASYSIQNVGNNIEFHIDDVGHVFWFNRVELQRFVDAASYYQRGASDIYRAVDAVEDERNGATDVFSYELLYNVSTRKQWLNSFTLLRESSGIEFNCTMISSDQ